MIFLLKKSTCNKIVLFLCFTCTLQAEAYRKVASAVLQRLQEVGSWQTAPAPDHSVITSEDTSVHIKHVNLHVYAQTVTHNKLKAILFLHPWPCMTEVMFNKAIIWTENNNVYIFFSNLKICWSKFRYYPITVLAMSKYTLLFSSKWHIEHKTNVLWMNKLWTYRILLCNLCKQNSI